MTDDNQTDTTEHHDETTDATDQDSPAAPGLIGVETRHPHSMGECNECGTTAATHVLPDGEALCGYCYGLRRGYISRNTDDDQDPARPPVDEAELQQLDGIRLGDDDSTLQCLHCGSVIRSGQLFAFASLPADEEFYEIEYVWCAAEWDSPPIAFHEGRRELVVRGTYGTCTNPATGHSYPVLLNPTVTKLSEISETTETLSDAQKTYLDTVREESDIHGSR